MRTIVAIAAVLLAGGCTLKDGEAPPLAGPSEYALSVTLSAAPDQLPRDGSSQSVVTATVRDQANRPVGGQGLNLSVRNGSISETDIVTNSNGQASVLFTAPPSGTVGNEATISAVPTGSDARNTLPRTLSIRLTGAANATRPTPSFTFTPASPEVNANVRFDASATTDERSECFEDCTYNWDFGDGSTATGRIVTHTYTAARTYTVTLIVTDAAGTSESLAKTVIIAPVPAPTVTLTVAPNPPLADQRAVFTANATPASGHSIVSYAWDFGDGSTQTTTSSSVTKIYSARGTYVVTVTVTDDVGQTGTALLQFTIGGAGVTAAFTVSPSGPITNQAVQFNASASTGSAGAAISQWEWDFGDGNTATESVATTSHTYTTAGTYVVRLTVTDSSGRTGTTTLSVQVSDP